MESDVGVSSEERRPFRARFLNAVLTEVALARLDQRVDFLGGPALADGDQLHPGRIALRNGGRALDPRRGYAPVSPRRCSCLRAIGTAQLAKAAGPFDNIRWSDPATVGRRALQNLNAVPM